MKILLLNNNPVVNKLVTLSAQKTSNTLDVAESVGAVESKNYDILIVDDALYSEDAMNELKDKIEYGKSLYICSKDAKPVPEFTKILKKPFLPTDLVELFITLAKETNTINLDKLDSSSNFEELDESLDEEIEELNESEEIAELDDLDDLEGLDLDDDLEIKESDKDRDSYELEEDDDIDFENLDESLDDDIDFDEEEDFDNLELTQDKSDSVLDKDELNEVKNLLDESDMEEFDSEEFDLAGLADMQSSQAKENILEVEDDTDDNMFEDLELEGDDLELDDDDDEIGFEDLAAETPTSKSDDKLEDEFKFEDELEVEDNFGFDNKLEVEDDLKSEDDLELEEDIEEDFALEDDDDDKMQKLDEESSEYLNSDLFSDTLEEDNSEEENSEEAVHDEEADDLEDLESKIESAVKELSDEDLQSEVDEDMLMDIDSLTSRDLKIAIGEEVAYEEFSEADKQAGFDESIEESEAKAEVPEIPKEINASSNDGVEALKKLLKALSNEEVAASLKGMKININITLGDQ
ncbi:MAG: hypothetical protein A2525_08810 [Sulfurimonas sp. RIFOXYD12_FULL_36_11]|uniref:DNA topoisomerase IV n=1 Tax=Sulfurimonas sp. RIFOXYB12_FULL_35_9 TaxID=1802256 RepID=UPI0008CDCE6B|nr:DNA topoisomerase IV [Sulfurimonas sp. RIFOXYB12_FULL_35_9]OHE04392.1 MAG: hypothetical protein A2345_09760 [Sulfurimonas sp. RIFOXYB12_FULL_35_9]OHE16077.1 MAG: hypothetical protein A2329_04550 [Sulfurimonas sp. RIFOXYB2_FULL_37_5]OHE16482.1 MAG: hypothetical protein A2525_08810 [Sulfurimonas sp. RIFOXYD12_FULL_36_11]